MQQQRKAPGWLRAQMPETAAFIDAMRAAFGAAVIDPAIQAGARGEPGGMYAVENGVTFGVAPPPPVQVVELFGADRAERTRPAKAGER